MEGKKREEKIEIKIPVENKWVPVRETLRNIVGIK